MKVAEIRKSFLISAFPEERYYLPEALHGLKCTTQPSNIKIFKPLYEMCQKKLIMPHSKVLYFFINIKCLNKCSSKQFHSFIPGLLTFATHQGV